MNFCSRFLRLFVLPWCRRRPQIVMCCMARMIREVEMSGDWFGCVLVISFNVKSLPSYIKDTYNALEIFRDFNFSGENKLIFTMDIPSLYTVIPNNEGLQPVRFFFDQRTIKQPSSETLFRLAELVLTLNCFLFGDNHYKQVNGVAVGTKMGPSYANLVVGYIKKSIFQPIQWHQTCTLRSAH